MATIKNLALLEEQATKKEISMMEAAASLHSQYNNTSFKIIEVKPKSVTVQITQGKNSAGAYHNQKRLIEIVHETFGRFFPNQKIMVHAIPFVESPANKVDDTWINKKMLETGVRLKEMASDTGIDYSQLSSAVNGRSLSQPMKALFYYYFLVKTETTQP